MCYDGNVCPCTSISREDCPDSNDGGKAIDCVPSGGTGDPKFTAFDGSTFYFHGLHENRYIIHAASHGDTLVAKMRATNELWLGVNRTYFEQFGLQLGISNTKLRFFLRRDPKTSHWNLAKQLNGNSFPSNLSAALPSSVEVVESREKVEINTPFTQYTIKGVSLNSFYRRHLDFSVRIKRLDNGHQFSGILGRTVSKKTPFLIRTVDSDDKKKRFEMKMRGLYTVKTIFPSIKALLKSVKFVTADVRVA